MGQGIWDAVTAICRFWDPGLGPGLGLCSNGHVDSVPGTRYTKADDGVHIAYQVFGQGPFDLVVIPGFISHVELAWEDEALARALRRLGSFSRVIMFDKRGTGLSDRTERLPDVDRRMLDIEAVMHAV